MSNKTLALAILLSFATLAQAQTAPAPTFADIANAQAEVKMQELRNRLHEAKAKEMGGSLGMPGGVAMQPAAPQMVPSLPPPMPAPAASPVAEAASAKKEEKQEEKIILVAIYGVGSKLSAEIQYNGVTHTVRAGGRNSQIGPWTVEAISPYHVALVKPAEVKKQGKKEIVTPAANKDIYLANEVAPEPAEQDANAARGSMPGMIGMPPMGVPFGMPPAARSGQPR